MLLAAVEAVGRSNVDFIDAYHARHSQRRGFAGICSYDRDRDRLDVQRIEPAELVR